MRAEVINAMTVSVGSDCLAIIDHSDQKIVRIFEVSSGKEIGKHAAISIISVCIHRSDAAICSFFHVTKPVLF
jgi:hypothetical protein